MKKTLGVFTVIFFILAVCAYARITVIYPFKDINIVGNSKENHIEIKRINQQVIREIVEVIDISTYEMKKNVQEQGDKANNSEYSGQWISEHISGITFEESVTQEDIDRIADMQNLKLLTISVSGDDVDLSPLGGLDKLQELRIFFVTGADNVDLAFIKNLRYLTKINLNKCTSLRDLSLFEDMIFLQDLSVGYVDDVDLNLLTGCTSLENISITGGHIRNATGLSKLIHVHSLELHDTQHTQQGKKSMMNDLGQISNLKGLERIELKFIDVSDIDQLGNLPNLRWIRLVGTGVSDIQSLSNLELLETMEIYGNRSERVSEQAERYFKDIERVIVTEDIPNSLSNY